MSHVAPAAAAAYREEKPAHMRFGVVVFPGTWSDCDFHYVISEVHPAAGQVRVAPRSEPRRPRLRRSFPAASRTATTCARAPWPAAPRWWRRCRAFLAARRARARLVQRLSDPLRGGPAAGRARCATSACSTAVSRRTWWSTTSRRRSRGRCGPARCSTMPISHGEGKYHADAATLRALRAAQPDRLPLRDRRRASHAGREPQRLAREHRGIVNEDGDGARAHAAPRAGGRVGHGRHRRAADLPLAPRQPRRGRHLPSKR